MNHLNDTIFRDVKANFMVIPSAPEHYSLRHMKRSSRE